MTVNEASRLIYSYASSYFASAAVCFGKEGGIKVRPPVLVVTPGSVRRSTHPIITVSADGVPVSLYPSTMRVALNLFTNGHAVPVTAGQTTPHENSAVSDMAEFINYLDSFSVTDKQSADNITICLDGEIQDVSAFIDDVDVDFRARCEITVDFLQSAAAAFAVRHTAAQSHKPNASGGGTQALAEIETGYFTDVERPKDIKEEIT